jgi:hypothetical protein
MFPEQEEMCGAVISRWQRLHARPSPQIGDFVYNRAWYSILQVTTTFGVMSTVGIAGGGQSSALK